MWGLLNGAYLLVGTATKKIRDRLWKAFGLERTPIIRRGMGIAITFLLTLAAWTFFRASTIQDALYILSHFYQDWDFSKVSTSNFLLRQLPFAIGGILAIELIHVVQYRHGWGKFVKPLPTLLRWTAYIAFVLSTILFGVFRDSQFIYFQF